MSKFLTKVENHIKLQTMQGRKCSMYIFLLKFLFVKTLCHIVPLWCVFFSFKPTRNIKYMVFYINTRLWYFASQVIVFSFLSKTRMNGNVEIKAPIFKSAPSGKVWQKLPTAELRQLLHFHFKNCSALSHYICANS